MGNNPINSMEFGVMDANLGVMNESYREQIFTLPFTMTEYNAPPYTLTYTGVAGCSDWFDMGDYTDDCEEIIFITNFYEEIFTSFGYHADERGHHGTMDKACA